MRQSIRGLSIASVNCRALYAELLAGTAWGNKGRRYFLSRVEEYVEGLKTALGIWWVPAHENRQSL
jgi:hypothetical protein